MANHDLPRGIRPRGNKWFVDVTVNGKRLTATCETIADAIQRRDEMKSDMSNGKEVRAVRANAVGWSLQQALDKALATPPKTGWKGCSYEKQARLNALDAINFFGPDRKIETLSLVDCDAWLNDCEARGNSNSTVNRKLSALSKLVKVAHKYGGLREVIELPDYRREPVGRIRQISPDEEDTMLVYLEQCGEREMADAVSVLIDTGMRRGELMNLRPSDVSFETNVAMIYGVENRGTKNGHFRSVPMTKRVRGILERYKYGATCFGLSESDMRHKWDRARSHMGLTSDKQFTLHVCRHTCASRLVQKGVSLPVVKQWLGHRSLSTTLRYSHLYPHDLMNAVKALEP